MQALAAMRRQTKLKATMLGCINSIQCVVWSLFHKKLKSPFRIDKPLIAIFVRSKCRDSPTDHHFEMPGRGFFGFFRHGLAERAITPSEQRELAPFIAVPIDVISNPHLSRHSRGPFSLYSRSRLFSAVTVSMLVISIK